jgi:copper chaperone CopZ
MTTVLSVPDMTCGHCKAAVEKALLDVEGVQQAAVDLDVKTVAIEHQASLTLETLRNAVQVAGYSVTGVSG